MRRGTDVTDWVGDLKLAAFADIDRQRLDMNDTYTGQMVAIALGYVLRETPDNIRVKWGGAVAPLFNACVDKFNEGSK